MPRQFYSAGEAAKTLGISLDTLRRWDRDGKIETARDSSNRRIVAAAEIERLRGEAGGGHLSARNRFSGTVTDVQSGGSGRPGRAGGRRAAPCRRDRHRRRRRELGLHAGMPATAVVKATSVMVQHSSGRSRREARPYRCRRRAGADRGSRRGSAHLEGHVTVYAAASLTDAFPKIAPSRALLLRRLQRTGGADPAGRACRRLRLGEHGAAAAAERATGSARSRSSSRATRSS